MTDEVKVICKQCNDTHQMPYGETGRLVSCTQCPVPCQDCRSGGTGAFCETTPCRCDCHSYNHTKPAEKFIAAVKERKPNFSPPGWLVRQFDIQLSEETAKAFQDYRQRRCEEIGSNDHTGHEHLHWNALIEKAVAMFVSSEEKLRTEDFSLQDMMREVIEEREASASNEEESKR